MADFEQELFDIHSKRIDAIEKLVMDINRQLIQIKACAYGAIGMGLASQLGIVEALKVGAG
jgi:hypothetical protein